jgi:predicted AAA+ superfamily ATPase
MAVWKEPAADKSMVFISGPRRVGKTTSAKSISKILQITSILIETSPPTGSN